jgi:hypothetical protein
VSTAPHGSYRDQREVGGPERPCQAPTGLGFGDWHPLLHRVGDHAHRPGKYDRDPKTLINIGPRKPSGLELSPFVTVEIRFPVAAGIAHREGRRRFLLCAIPPGGERNRAAALLPALIGGVQVLAAL